MRIRAHLLVENARACLLVVAQDGQSAGSIARHHRSGHQDISVDRSRAAEYATLNIDEGAIRCRQSAVYEGGAGGLRVIRAGCKKAGAFDRYSARVRECSKIVKSSSIQKIGSRSVVQNAVVIECTAHRVVYRAGVYEGVGGLV